MSLFTKIFLSIFLLACVGFGSWLVYHELHMPQSQGEVLNRMIELQREKRYDKAASVVENWLSDSKRDPSHDGFLYGQIAFVYIAKAYKRPSSRGDSLLRAERSLERERALVGREPFDLQTDLYQIGGSYEILGDLSDKDKCRYYGTAKTDLKRQLLLIQGDSVTAYGKTSRLEPLRREVSQHLDAVEKKSLNGNCPDDTREGAAKN